MRSATRAQRPDVNPFSARGRKEFWRPRSVLGGSRLPLAGSVQLFLIRERREPHWHRATGVRRQWPVRQRPRAITDLRDERKPPRDGPAHSAAFPASAAAGDPPRDGPAAAASAAAGDPRRDGAAAGGAAGRAGASDRTGAPYA